MDKIIKTYPILKDSDEETILFIKNQIKSGDQNIRKYIKALIGPFIIDNYLKYKNMPKKQIYDIEWNMCKYSINRDEAIKKINELKNKTSGSKDNFIKRYGEEEGLKKFNNFREKSAHTKEKFLNKYGEDEGKKKWDEYLKSKDSSSLTFYINKYGEEKGSSLYKQKIENSKQTKQNFIKRYGEEEGAKRWTEYRELKSFLCKTETLINKYGEEKVYNILKSKSTQKDLSHYIDKYGLIDGTDKFILNVKTKTPNPKLERYIEEYGYEDGVNFYLLEKEKTTNKGTASSESLKIFKKSIEFLEENDIDYYIGVSGNKEYRITHDNKRYYYDFTIPSLNIIIEFNGSHVHVNPNWEEEKIVNWKHAYIDISPNDMMQKDKDKKDIALIYGYDLYYLWDEDGITFNSNKALDIIKEKYENKKDNK